VDVLRWVLRSLLAVPLGSSGGQKFPSPAHGLLYAKAGLAND
jgi:hypothetical protein